MTAPRHILVTADAIGGVWNYTVELARGLVLHGYRTSVAVLGPGPTPAQAAELTAIPGARLVETGLPVDWICADARPVRAAGDVIAALARSIGADIVHANMPTLVASATFDVPVIAVTHGCIATWWNAARQTPLDPAYRWQREMMAEGLARADAVVAPSASYAATVAKEYGLTAAPIVVHNGRTQVLSVGVQEPAPHALTVGRLWDNVKRAEVLDRAAALIDQPFRAAGAVVGPHGERPDLTHLEVLGELDARILAGELARRPVFVSAACFEPFGLAVLEAAQAGCALVLSDIPTFRELWNGAAVFVEGDDEAGYATAIRQLFEDPELRRLLGQHAARRARRYTPEATAASMALLYDGLLARQQAAV